MRQSFTNGIGHLQGGLAVALPWRVSQCQGTWQMHINNHLKPHWEISFSNCFLQLKVLTYSCSKTEIIAVPKLKQITFFSWCRPWRCTRCRLEVQPAAVSRRSWPPNAPRIGRQAGRCAKSSVWQDITVSTGNKLCQRFKNNYLSVLTWLFHY